MAVAGTRPEVIKLAPILRAMDARGTDYLFITSGQHYDYELLTVFLKELELREPDDNLRVGSGSHAEQVARMLVGYERLIRKHRPKITLAVGDTNTVLALGLASIKEHVPFGHVEAGLRNYDRTMPEEVNRVLAAQTAELHFAPTERAALNLLYEGIDPRKIFVTGNTVVDACTQNLELANRMSTLLQKLGLKPPIVTVTFHRAENVENRARLSAIVKSLLALDKCQIVLPVHPRTKTRLKASRLWGRLAKARHIVVTKPLGYLDFLHLLSSSEFVITDSGGIQEEALAIGVPCLTLRTATERPETLELGVNVLVGSDPDRILSFSHRLLNDKTYAQSMRTNVNPLGDGKAAERIVDVIERGLKTGLKIEEPVRYEAGADAFALLNIDERLDGLTVAGFESANSLKVSLVYDHEGNPLFPSPETVLRPGFACRIVGPKPLLNKVLRGKGERVSLGGA